MTTGHASEIARGERFEFGANWANFLRTVNAERIEEAERSLVEMLERKRLDGLTFLDIGCGSGLFSLAAHRLGATVNSFDFDPASVACALELRRRYAPDSESWTIGEGSVLDSEQMTAVGTFDVVYSWGVLHHTGNMQLALENACLPVADRGQLFIAIYNDQGWRSKAWLRVKRLYCSGLVGRWAVTGLAFPVFTLQAIVAGLVRDRRPWSRFSQYKKDRGMSIVHDWIDWLGGLPYEYASVQTLQAFVGPRGFVTDCVRRTDGWGCNQLVFSREASTGAPSV